MTELHLNPTRTELKQLQARYLAARRGHRLLSTTRDGLMRHLLSVTQEARALRERVEAAPEDLATTHEELPRLAALEKEAQLLSAEIERTRRRMSALEHMMMPRLAAAIKRIKARLDENERDNTTRLLKIKDRMLAAQRAGKDDFFPDEEE